MSGAPGDVLRSTQRLAEAGIAALPKRFEEHDGAGIREIERRHDRGSWVDEVAAGVALEFGVEGVEALMPALGICKHHIGLHRDAFSQGRMG